MSWKCFELLKPAPYQPIDKSPSEIDKNYREWRLRICYSIFFGYAFFYFTRKSFTFAMPFMAADLGFTKAELGMLGSILYISYGISKLVSGIMSDRANPRYFMAFGLIITGILNIFFATSSSLMWLAIFWGLNGWFQAWGWPACCKQLNYWFAQSERGLWYSICSTSHNLGGALIPLMIVPIAQLYDWRIAIYTPAILSIFMGLILINRLRDVPRTLGLPSVEDYKAGNHNCEKKVKKLSEESTTHSFLRVKDILFKQVLSNKYVWIFAISYFFVYVVRTAINDWTIFYLPQAKDMDYSLAKWGIFWFETGGFAGMILAGWGSDYFWKGNRVPVMVICGLGLVLSLVGLKLTPVGMPYADMTFLALIGAFVFGPQMIVGLAAAEFVDKRAAASSNGFAGTLGYFGAAFAGYPVGKMIDVWGWDGFFLALLVSSAFIIALLLPLWRGDAAESNKLGWSNRRRVEE